MAHKTKLQNFRPSAGSRLESGLKARTDGWGHAEWLETWKHKLKERKK